MPNINEYTPSEGCESSKADALHDFTGIFKKSEILTYVNYNIPQYDGLECNDLSEDAFIDKYELNPESESSAAHKADREFLINNLNQNINQRYKSTFIARPQKSYREIPKSLIQEYLNQSGISSDVFFVCDVAYANVREDLKFADPKNPQIFYWVQNAQTLYDPAGKTTWHSDKPYFEDEVEPTDDAGSARGSSSPTSPAARVNAPNHFKMNDSRFVFCWQNAKTDIVTFYPEWSKTSFPDKDASYKFSSNKPEQMLYTNKNLFLNIKAENVDDYASHEAYLIITDPNNPGYYGYADKILSAKGTGILKPAELASYRAKGDQLKRFVKFINDNVNWTNKDERPGMPRPELFLDEVMNYSSYFQVLAKKVGDASQSLSCCQKVMNLQKFKDNVYGPKQENNIINFTSNGNHAFVSFDRLAIGCALNFNCPIVLGDTQEGIYVYIRLDLLNVHKQFDNYFKKIKEDDDSTPYQLFNVFKMTPTSVSYILNEELYTTIGGQTRLVNENITTACLNLNLTPVSDITYQNFLINHFIELNVLQLFSNLNLEVLNFNVDNFNYKIQKIYYEKLALIVKYCEALPTPIRDFCELKEIISITNINELINTIVENLSELLKKIKDSYNLLKTGEDTSTYTNENPKHQDYLNLLKVLKEIEKIITEIYEIQKLLQSNLNTMIKLNEYQTVINLINNQPTRNDETKINDNIKNLPKGIATNVATCTPFSYYLTNSRAPRTSDIFFERSTSIFGTTTLILQIFNILKCQQLEKLNKRFVKNIFIILNELTIQASNLSNISFISIVNAAKAQFNDLLITEPSEPVLEITLANLNQFITLQTPPLPTPPPLVDPLQTNCSAPVIPPAEPEEISPPIPARAISSIIVENEEKEEDIKEFLKNKDLIITKHASTFTAFRDRIELIRDLNKSDFKKMFNVIISGGVDPAEQDEKIQTAYENEIFIKGFIGLFAFMKYTQINSAKRVPTLFIMTTSGSQNNILERLFGFLYLNIDDNKKNINILEEIRQIKDDISRKIPGIDINKYRALPDSEKRLNYVKGLIEETGANIRITGSSFTGIVNKLNKYVEYSIKIEESIDLYQEIDAVDAKPPIDKSDFSVDSFKKLLKMNVIAVDSKPLTGKFKGVNANEINANMALLYFIENRIASLNREPLPHPDLVGLFSQLFKQSGLNPQEYITERALARGGLKGGGDGLFDVMYDLFVENDDRDFKLYRKNSYLLLNMPNNYEIAINNFQSYPYEILMFLQELKREYDQEQSRDKYVSNLGNLARGGPTSNFYDNISNNPPNLLPTPLMPIKAFGGKLIKRKIKTNKYKLKKNKTKKLKTRRLKFKKNKTKRLKTRRLKFKKRITKNKHR